MSLIWLIGYILMKKYESDFLSVFTPCGMTRTVKEGKPKSTNWMLIKRIPG